MRKLMILASILTLLLGACHQAGSDTEPAGTPTERIKMSYEVSNENFANPERGWFHSLTPNYALETQSPPLTVEQLRTYRGEHVTVVRKVYLLEPFLGARLSEDYLAELEGDLNAARKAGIKLAPRFVYMWTPDPGTWPTNNAPGTTQRYTPDASLGTVTRHLAQLEPLLWAHQDVIAYLEAGLVGYWGEWHDSSYGHVDNWTLELQESGKQILAALLKAVPPSRMVLMRYPWQHHIALYPEPLTVEAAYRGGDQARLGFHNDWFQSEKDGWYHHEEVARQQRYTEQSTAYTVMSGEPGVWNEGFSAEADPVGEMRTLHYSTFNRNADASLQFYENWEARGLTDEIARTLGYRFQLRSADIPREAEPGGSLEVLLEMANVGAARPYNPRGLELVLRREGRTVRLEIAQEDTRLFLPGPGETATLTLRATLPDDLAPGAYELLLNLPDPAPSLNKRPEYSVRLANTSVWEEETGYNRLGASLEVTR